MAKWGELQFCNPCFFDRTGKVPFRIAEEYRETTECPDCGDKTRSGIYLRVNLDEFAQ